MIKSFFVSLVVLFILAGCCCSNKRVVITPAYTPDVVIYDYPYYSGCDWACCR